MCRLETRSPTREAREDFESGMTLSEAVVGKHIWGRRFSDSDGTFRTVMFVAREGQLRLQKNAADEAAE